MIQAICNFLKEFIAYLLALREDKKEKQAERKEDLNKINDVANNGTLNDLFKYLNDKQSKE